MFDPIPEMNSEETLPSSTPLNPPPHSEDWGITDYGEEYLQSIEQLDDILFDETEEKIPASEKFPQLDRIWNDPLTGAPLYSEVSGNEYSFDTEPPKQKEEDYNLIPEQILKKYWGYNGFRPKQKEIIESILSGQDTLGLLPTGGGKSITFQVPAMMRPGITIVISPLIALMKDQVDNLRRRGIRAATLHSGLSAQEQERLTDNVIFGGYKFLYVSPERLSSELFIETIRALEVAFLVVDECHCISQWGYDFRPSYLNIHTIRDIHPHVPLLALTATATPAVVQDIMRQLRFPKECVISTSFFRPNLAYVIRRTRQKEEELLHILSRVSGSSIVYCRNREGTQQLAKLLRNEGITADHFHAGLTHAERELKQNSWMNDEIRVMVCTNAFGMGIDKPDVRLVVHWSLPNSIEEYFQEAGRAGRDQQKSYAVALVAPPDPGVLKRRIEDGFPPKLFVRQVYDAICSYLRIGIGEGYERSFTIDIEQFARKNKLNVRQVMSAIRILEMSNVWELRTHETQSMVLMECKREDLYNHGYTAPHIDAVLRAMLRLYGGLFADYCFINETVLGIHCGLSHQEVYDTLSFLSQTGLLHYVPRKHLPRLYFLSRREEGQHLIIPPTVYEGRKQAMSDRIHAMRAYMTSDRHCRAQMLLAYFGETYPTPCGMCDVCLKVEAPGLKHHQVERIMLYLQAHDWDASPILSIEKLAQRVNLSRQTTAIATEFLCAQTGRFTLTAQGIIALH